MDDACGPLFSLYTAARREDVDALRDVWETVDEEIVGRPADARERLADAVDEGEPALAADRLADALFEDAETPVLDGPAASLLGHVLHAIGYIASFVLFFRAHSRETVVSRLRWAYRMVGVDIRHTETADGVERTTFRCPYRNLGAGRVGRRHACHDVLDRVDDGYVTFLARHRDLDYQRPRACAASECCYSELSER